MVEKRSIKNHWKKSLWVCRVGPLGKLYKYLTCSSHSEILSATTLRGFVNSEFCVCFYLLSNEKFCRAYLKFYFISRFAKRSWSFSVPTAVLTWSYDKCSPRKSRGEMWKIHHKTHWAFNSILTIGQIATPGKKLRSGPMELNKLIKLSLTRRRVCWKVIISNFSARFRLNSRPAPPAVWKVEEGVATA